jgi:hypothetical protein
LVAVTLCAPLEKPAATDPNARLAGVTVSMGAGPAVPVPPSATVCVPLLALLANDSEAVAVATAVGVKRTVVVQLAPTASVPPQFVVWLNWAADVPERTIPENVSRALPVFVAVTVCAVLELPATTAPNAILAGATVSTASVPLPPDPGTIPAPHPPSSAAAIAAKTGTA